MQLNLSNRSRLFKRINNVTDLIDRDIDFDQWEFCVVWATRMFFFLCCLQSLISRFLLIYINVSLKLLRGKYFLANNFLKTRLSRLLVPCLRLEFTVYLLIQHCCPCCIHYLKITSSFPHVTFRFSSITVFHFSSANSTNKFA